MLRKLEHPAKISNLLQVIANFIKNVDLAVACSQICSILWFLSFVSDRQTDSRQLKAPPIFFSGSITEPLQHYLLNITNWSRFLLKYSIKSSYIIYQLLSNNFCKKNDKILFLKKYFVKPQNYDRLPKFYWTIHQNAKNVFISVVNVIQ